MDRNNKAVIFIISGVALVVLGLGITFLVIKKPFRGKEIKTSETKKVIQLDVPGQTSEEVKKADAGEDEMVPDTTKETKEKEKEKTPEKKNVTTTTTKKETTSEKTSETKKQDQQAQQPVIIVEDPKTAPTPTTPTATTAPATSEKSDDVIELPFVPYEDLKEN